MRTYILEKESFINESPEQVFTFFSSAENLEKVTPVLLHFEILTPLPIEIRLLQNRRKYTLNCHSEERSDEESFVNIEVMRFFLSACLPVRCQAGSRQGGQTGATLRMNLFLHEMETMI